MQNDAYHPNSYLSFYHQLQECNLTKTLLYLGEWIPNHYHYQYQTSFISSKWDQNAINY